MGTYLEDHPPRRSQYRKPRREALSGVVVLHTAENTPDYVAFDGGAEAVANFIRTRSDAGSYHDLVDSDSAVGLISYDDEAFHDATGSNRHSLGLSIATRADVWPLAPQAWREGAIEQAARRAARMAAHVKARTGIVIPPRRITRAESEARKPGFISHGERDPGRRTDPGATFPWDQFLRRFAELTAVGAPVPSTPSPSGARILKVGLRGDDVREWQRLLIGAGHLAKGQDDGIFGPGTEAATKRFQSALKVDADGIVGPGTRKAVGDLLAWLGSQSHVPAFPGTVKLGDRGAAVSAHQEGLRKNGYTLRVDGVFGPATQHAVRDFQRSHRLRVDGISGEKTWDVMWR